MGFCNIIFFMKLSVNYFDLSHIIVNNNTMIYIFFYSLHS